MRHGNVAVFVPHVGCPQRCSFCDQNAISGAMAPPMPQDVGDVCRAAIAQRSCERLELAFFGGSFTAIDTRYRIALLDAAQEFLGNGIDGIRVSTRPDAVDDEKLSQLISRGVTAVELGAQSMDDTVLEKNNRGHMAQDVRDAAARIRGFGLELGLQMMIGLDGEAESGGEQTARELIACQPDTVRIYPVLVLRGTELARRMLEGRYTPLTIEEGVARTARVMELFGQTDIRIIRVGLHPSESLEQRLLAGPYHPAFRELCEGRIMRNRLLSQLNGRPPGKLIVKVRPQDISRMIGQRRCNKTYLAERGFALSVRPDPAAAPLTPTTD